ncbi:MAG: ABC transporter ATP-binding protein [Pseudomonadales bacterium]|nr:ABC transporter ATP-binding protein [Pseudomonadales bacterium]
MKLKLDNISLAYGKNTVLKNISVELKKGENACLIGPSGSGKSSVLRAIAGFEPLTKGAIYLGENKASSAEFVLPPERRKVGMLFQDLALFPHLTVKQNIAFGLTHLDNNAITEKVSSLLALIGMAEFGDRYSHQLSGGQQQRVALARALATDPDLLLLDEPFSSLDSDLRRELVTDVYRIFKQKNMTTLMVTHDQTEAFSVADKVGLLIDGELQQWDTPLSLYNNPTSKAVADFMGNGVYITGTVLEGNKIQTAIGIVQTQARSLQNTLQNTLHNSLHNYGAPGTTTDVLLRPENIQLNNDSPTQVQVIEHQFRGADSLVTVKLDSGETLRLSCHNKQHIVTGNTIGIEPSQQPAVAFPITSI